MKNDHQRRIRASTGQQGLTVVVADVRQRRLVWPQMSIGSHFLAAIVLVSCGASVPSDPPAQVEHTGASTYEFGQLIIWPTVDTTDVFNAEAIACLRRFCLNKVHPEINNDYWYTPDLERFGGIHQELLYAEFDSVGDARYPPTLLAIRGTGIPDQRVLSVRWALMDSAGVALRVRYVFDFLARRTADGVRLGFPLDHNTEHWGHKKVGQVSYIVSPEHTFSAVHAQQQMADIERLSRFFELPSFPITYYSCTDPTELFRIRGYQQHPLMHLYPTGGRAEGKDIVFSGNNKDVYTHEIVHLFTGRKFAERSWVLDEGLATVLAGSSEHSFTWHRSNLKRFLEAGSEVDLVALFNTYDPMYINEHTNVAYAVGGVLCERILRRKGKAALFKALSSGTDPWPVLAEYEITRETLRSELVKELALDPLIIP